MPTLHIKFCGPSIDGVNQEACNFHSNICHRHVWWLTQFAIIALLWEKYAWMINCNWAKFNN